MSKLEKLVDDLSALSVIEAAELSKLLEEKWGVSAAAPVAVAAVAAGAAAGAAVEEQTEFTVVLAKSGDKKKIVIIRTQIHVADTSLGADSKNMTLLKKAGSDNHITALITKELHIVLDPI